MPLSPDEQWLQEVSAQYAKNAKYSKGSTFDTQLSPEQEQAFRKWVADNKVPFHPDDPSPSDYDMRGFYQAAISGDPEASTAINPNDGQIHYTDKFKTPWHKSFSNESMYAQPDAPKWINDHQLLDQRTGQVVFDEQAKKLGMK